MGFTGLRGIERGRCNEREAGMRRVLVWTCVLAILGAATAYVQPWVTDAVPALRGPVTVGRSIRHRDGHLLDVFRADDRLMTMRTVEVLDLGGSDDVAGLARGALGLEGPREFYPRWFDEREPRPEVWTRSGVHRPESWGAGHRRVVEVDSGWPLRSMWSMWSWDASAHEGPLPRTATQGVFNLRIGSGRGVALPYWLLPAGFAGNAAVFAAAWGAVLLGPPAAVRGLRRHRRARRGACLGCGYDLRGAPGRTCPECGREGSVDHPAGVSA